MGAKEKFAANIGNSRRVHLLVPKVVPQCKARIDGCLWKCRGNREFREGMIIEEQRVQTFAQGIIGSELDGH